MKNLIIIAIFTLLIGNVLAQDTTRLTFAQIFDSHSMGLIKSRIPTGILYDRVFPWAGLQNWTDGDTTNQSHITQAWYELDECNTLESSRGNSYNAMKATLIQTPNEKQFSE